ncbi:MAG: DNA-processing protein DprA [Thermogutta sp.]
MNSTPLILFDADDASYPSAVRIRCGNSRPRRLAALGNLAHLDDYLLAVFCSGKCPGNLILDTYDLARTLRDSGVVVVSGFHSRMEKECLELLLRGKQPIVICPARGLQRMRVPPAWKTPLESGRLLILSPFSEKERRITADLAVQRNRFAATLADEIFIAYAAPGSKTEGFCKALLAENRTIMTFDREENAGLLNLGARPWSIGGTASGGGNAR